MDAVMLIVRSVTSAAFGLIVAVFYLGFIPPDWHKVISLAAVPVLAGAFMWCLIGKWRGEQQ